MEHSIRVRNPNCHANLKSRISIWFPIISAHLQTCLKLIEWGIPNIYRRIFKIMNYGDPNFAH